MEITEVRIAPSDDEGIAAYASITIDNCFVIHGLRLKISKKGDYFLFMPGRRQADGVYTEIVFPVDNGTRRMIEEKVFAAYQIIASEPVTGRKLKAP
jgi:stage V sporulation protein G